MTVNHSGPFIFHGVTSPEIKHQQWCRICRTNVRSRNILRNTRLQFSVQQYNICIFDERQPPDENRLRHASDVIQ